MRKPSTFLGPVFHPLSGNDHTGRSIPRVIKKINPVLSDISPIAELLNNPALHAKRLTMQPGKVLFEPADDAKHLYFLHRGQIRLQSVDTTRGAVRLIDILGPDDWCGEAAFEKHARYSAQAIVVVSSIITEVSADRLSTILAHHPRALTEILQQLAGKISESRNDASSMVFDDCYSRLLKTLIRFSTSAAAITTDETTVLRMTHLQLAQCVGAWRETISLTLTQLRHKHLLRTGRNQLSFKTAALKTFLAAHEKSLRPINNDADDSKVN